MGARTEVTLAQPPGTVWLHLSQPARILSWCRSVASLSRPLDSPAGTPLALLCRRPDGSVYSCTGQVLESDPPRLLRWRTVSDRFEATSTYRLEPCGGGTRLEHELEVEALHRLAHPLAGAAQTCLSMHHAADLRRLRGLLDPGTARRETPVHPGSSMAALRQRG